MDWRIKASIQKILSATYIGDKINHFGSRLMNPNYMDQKIDYHISEALIHIDKLNRCGYTISEDDVFLELGTGYAIVESLTMILLGAQKVITVDITEDVKFSESLKYINMFSSKHIAMIADKSCYTEKQIREKLNSLKQADSQQDFLKMAGIVYIAPYSISDLEKYRGKINVCYSQVVLEHIPKTVMEGLFSESRQFMAEGGYHSHIANLTDHFRNPGLFRDNSVTDINFLRYSDKYWNRWCDNDIAFVNRLRFPFYIDLFTKLGFEILDVDKQKEEGRMNELLSYEDIHDDIKSKYGKKELMDTLWVQRFHIICKNPSLSEN